MVNGTLPLVVENVYFSVADYIVFTIFMALPLAIGIYYGFFGSKNSTTSEYFVGNRNMGCFPVTVSLLAGHYSSITLIGTPAEVYRYGSYLWFSVFGYMVATPVVVYLFVPVFYNAGITSVYEYLERRFNKTIRLLCSIISTVCLIFYLSFIIYGTSAALSQVTGLGLWGSVLVMTAVATVYTSLGGIKAVMWADVIQIAVTMTSMLAAIIQGIINAGGIDNVFNVGISGKRVDYLSFSFDPRIRYTFWGLEMSGFLQMVSNYGTSQFLVQRYLAAPNLQMAKQTIWWNIPGNFLMSTLALSIGLVIYVAYRACDPLLANRISTLDQIYPLFVMDTLSSLKGMPGLFVAGVFSASLSTVSSLLNALSAVTTEDYLKSIPYFRKMNDHELTILSKISAVTYGIICVILVQVVSNLGTIVEASLSVLGSIWGITTGVFVIGLFFPWIHCSETLISLIFGTVIGLWLAFGITTSDSSMYQLPVSVEDCLPVNISLSQEKTDTSLVDEDDVLEVYKISYLWMLPISFFLVVIIANFVRLITFMLGMHKKENTAPEYLSPLVTWAMSLRKQGIEDQRTTSENSNKNDGD